MYIILVVSVNKLVVFRNLVIKDSVYKTFKASQGKYWLSSKGPVEWKHLVVGPTPLDKLGCHMLGPL